jgi:DNA replication and repair protein RecF
MGFCTLKSYQFRNIKDGEVRLDAPRIFLVGENGQGKSNLLEAVYLLSFGSSFRTNKDQDLILRGKDEMALHGMTDDHTVSLAVSPKKGAGKLIRLNEKPVSDRKELVSTIPAIVFCHDDISFVTGAPDRQRWFFDQTMSLYEPLFIDTIREYRKIVKMRNMALREQQYELLDVYDTQLASAGMQIQNQRAEAIDGFNATFSSLHAQVSGIPGKLLIDYRPSWRGIESHADIVDLLLRRRESDKEMGTTGSGPHRDRFAFLLEGKDFSSIASTGQIRLLSLLMRVGQARYFHERSGRNPILLLDDVLLELDPARRERFLETLPASEQSFFTFLPDRNYLSLKDSDTLVIRVEQGAFFPDA